MAIELAAVFDDVHGPRFAAAERFILALPDVHGATLLSATVGYRARTRFLIALACFEPKTYRSDARARFEFWAGLAGGKVVALAALDAAQRASFDGRLAHCDVVAKEILPENLFDALTRVAALAGAGERRRQARVRAELALDLGEAGGKRASWDASEGGLFVPGLPAPPQGDELGLAVTVPGADAPFHVRARVAHVVEAGGEGRPAGFGLAFVAPPPQLVSALARHFGEKDLRGEGRRAAPRYPVRAPVLITPPPELARIDYGTDEEAARDYLENLSVGGAFVRTTRPPAPGTPIMLEIGLPAGRTLCVAGKVVYVRGDGMGVQFQLDEESDAALAELVAKLASRPQRALVVDDDALMRRILSDVLGGEGFEVLTARDGEAGLRVLFDELLALDLVVTDLAMPGMDGVTFVDRIRRAGGEADLALVVVTGRVDEATRAQLEAAGVDAVLDKAVGPEAVALAAVEALRVRRAKG